LYEARFIIPELRDYALGAYQKAVAGVLEGGVAMCQDRRYDQAVTTYLHSAYEDLRRYRLPDGVKKLYLNAMQEAGGLPWREAADVLAKGYQAVLDFEPEGDEPERADDYYRDAMASMPTNENAPSESGSEQS
jgi:hypothetical protein